jgi:hypothetical protein
MVFGHQSQTSASRKTLAVILEKMHIIKIIFKILSSLLLTSICFICAYWMFLTTSNVSRNVNSYENRSGKIIEKKISNNSSSVAGKYNLNSKIFTFKLEGYKEIFGIYNKEQNYQLLDRKLNINDKVKVYYKDNNSENLNLDIFQIEKKNEIVYNSSKYIEKERLGAYIALIGGFVLIGITINEAKKDYKKYYS